MFAIRRFRPLALSVLTILTGISSLHAQFHLTNVNPADAPPNIVNVQVSTTGFPAGATTANTTVTITPPSGNGSPVSVPAVSIVPPGPVTSKNITFQVPTSLTAAQPIANCTISVTANGTTANNTLPFQVDPPGSISSVTPGAGTKGTAVPVTIAGYFTHFQSGGLSVVNAGAGITVSSVARIDNTHLTALFTIDPAATPGARVVTVTTGAEIASLATGFLVAVNPSVSITVSPNSGVQGSNVDINITGTNTSFTSSGPTPTLVSVGDGVKINSVTVTDSLHATAHVSIDPIAYAGPRTVTVTTGGEYGVLANAFTVTKSAAALTSILPTGGAQGTSATITFNGNGTHWVPSGSLVSMGGGIVVGNISVTNNILLTANITIPPATAPGSYAATVTTLGEVVTLPGAFTVTAATPHLTGVSPTAGNQGQTLNVTVTGQFTNFQANSAGQTCDHICFNFGPNITVNTITVNSTTSVTANISISNTAFSGGRTVSLTSNGTIFNFNFTVNSSAAAITSINPTSGLQGASVAIQVTGVNTHWVDGLTQASLDPTWITINRVKVTNSTTAEVDISIATIAPIGPRTVTLSTGGEIVSFNSFTVLPFTPTMSLNPGSGMIGTSVPIVFNGNFTHWINGTTVANISGQGVSISGFKVDSVVSAHATFVIDPTAPSNGCVPGNRTVTLTTVAGSTDEIVTAPFCVSSTPAYLTQITPTHTGVPVNNLLVDIYGAFTHFDNTTSVGFGPNITLVGSPIIITPTHLQVTINVDANAALGYRQAFVNSACASCVPVNPEQLTIGFLLDYPATSSLVSVTPNTVIQGQTQTGVTVIGKLTNWGPTTLPILGLGITVANVTIVNPTTATMDITASPTTPAGGRNVVMITNNGGEVESGLGFSVTPSIANVSAVGIGTGCDLATNCPAPPNTIADINQGDTKSFRVIGVDTHFLQGETTLDFGPGISITQVNVVDATHLYGQITVSFQAATGYRSFRAITDGEIAPSFSNAINVHPVTGTINISPTTAPQGSKLDITVNGIGSTHFSQLNTSVTFGSGPGEGMVGQTNGTTTLSGADITVNSLTQMVLHVFVQGTAYCCTPAGLRDLTVTTTGVSGAPANIEQITLPLAFFVSQGAAIITAVSPPSDTQGHSVNLLVTGQNTNFATTVTTAYLTTGGCNPASPAGAVVTGVTASDPLHATLALAIDVNAATGVRGLCMYTLGEFVGFLNAFNVLPGVPTLNSVGPVSGLQGQTLTGVALLGNFTHWTSSGSNPTTVTFGQGITTSNLQIADATHATVDLMIDPIAQLGGRSVTVTTGTEVVSGNFFTVNAGPAILSTINPSHANQGQHILMQINGQFTHWAQGLTQFSIGGGDITVNGFVINNATTALADLTLSPTAVLGTRTVTMSTGGEVVSLNQGFLVTGGIPSLLSISPSSYKQCDTNDNVQITGAFTKWLTGGSPTTVFMGPNITVNSVTVNSDTALTAVISVPCGAPLGFQSIVVQGPVNQQGVTTVAGLPGQVQILSNAPPTPYISYENPSVALKGQTLTVYFAGAYTNWLPGGPNATQVTFGAGIQVNTFQVTSQTTAAANITIIPTATIGSRTVIFTTGAEVETTSFYVTVGTPAISLVDGPNGSTGIQGQTLLVNLVGAYTTWDSTMNESNFNFGAGITVVPGSVQIFGPTAARMQIMVAQLASLGGRSVVATHAITGGTETAYGYFSVSPSTATIVSVTPNTAMQGTQGFVTNVVGFSTHWDNSTQFTFGGSDVGVTLVNVIDATHASVTLNLAPLASPGLRNVTAQTGGEVATLINAFVVTPGTPILTNCVNCTPSSHVIQQNNFTATVLGQFTTFVSGWPAAGATTVDFGNGAIITSINVTGPLSVDVGGHIDPLAYVGCRDVTVTTGTQVLKLYGAFCIGYGPAAITHLTPNTGLQGTTENVTITGTNTNFCCVAPPNITVANFGPGISVNTLTINSPTSATANITIAQNATVEQNSVTLTTQGEIATIPLGFTIQSNTPTVAFITPTSGTQGTAADISVTGAFTHWSLANTTADFGSGITASVTAVADSTHATVHVVISPIAATGNHAVRMITNLGGGSQEIAVYTIGSGNGTPGYFVVNASGASIISATPTSPPTVHQNDNGDIIAIVGSGTHFTLAVPAVQFCSGVHAVAFQVTDDTHLSATVNVDTFATVGACGVTVTTGGEVATGSALFNVLSGLPVITSVSANSAHQGDTLSINVTGLYTHFTSGFTCALCGSANVTVNTHTVNNDTSLTLNITISPTAPTGAMDVTVQDAADGVLTDHNAFTVLAGVPQITSISIPNGPQGLTQAELITGLFTHWSNSSVVSVSGTGVTVGNPPSAPDNFHLNVNFSVAVGAPAGPRTVTVTTGSEIVSLSNAFTVQPGSPNLSSLTPNIGVPNSTVNVTLTGVFTHFTNGSTTANFGPFISVNGGGFGNNGLLTVSDATDATATLTIQAGATLGAYNVTVNTPAPPLAAPETFTVVNGFTIQNTPTTPVLLSITPAMGLSGTSNATNVPINTNVTVVFNEPMLASSITTANAFLTDASAGTGCWAASGIPATVSLDLSGRILTITPTGNLAVGHQFDLQLNSYSVPGGTPTIQDASGTQNLGHYCQAFTTGFAADSTGPTFLTGSIPNNATGVPTNAHPVLGFDKPVSPASMSAGLSIVQNPGATPVNGTWSYSTDYTQYTFTPASAFAASTQFVIGYTNALTDATGHVLTNPGTLTFTTGTGPDTSGPSVVSITPIYNSTVGTGPTIRLIANKPMNPLTFTDFYVWNNTSGGTNPGSSLFKGPLTWSADFKTFSMQLPGPLPVSTQFYWHMCSGYDWAGNYGICFNQYFYTGTGPDTVNPSVVSVSPPNSATNIAVNAPVWVHFSKALDPTAVPANAITLNGGAVAGSVAFAPGPDYTTLVFTPSANLAISTAYNVAVSGVVDTSGNPMTPFGGSSFTTGSSATADTTRGNVTITPTGSNVPQNTNVVFQLNKPVNPTTVNNQSMRVYDNTIGHDVPGTIAISADLKTLTFTQTLNFPSGHQICTWNGNPGYLYDLDGNQFNYTGQCFTVGSWTDNTPPTVTAVTPPNGATGVGPYNPVAVTFSKPINPGTINTNVAVYTGSTLYTSNYSLSSDATTIYFNTGALPYGTTFTLVAEPGLTDLAGNNLAAEFRSSFTTAPQPANTRPSVNTVRPATGATGVPVTATITFFTSAAMNTATVNANTVHVSQSGVLLNGNITFAASNQAITFTPTSNFTAGATIEAWFTSGAQDTFGNPLYDYYTHFVVAPDLSTTPLTLVSRGPCFGCAASDNSVVEVLFTKPVTTGTVTSSSFFVLANNNAATPVNGTISFFDGNRGIRFTPNSPGFPQNAYMYVYLGPAIQDTNNLNFAGSASNYNYYFYSGTTANNTPPFVTGLAPTNGAVNIGSNALVSVTFSENVDSLTLDPANVTLTGPGGNIPLSLSYNSSSFVLTITPQAPMPAGTINLQLNGINDYSGNPLNPTPYNASFTVQNAPDYNGPAITATSWQNGQTNVPVTSSFAITFNKPIDLRSVVPNSTVYLQDATAGYPNVPFNLSWSAGNTVMLITPTPASGVLNVNHQYRILAGCGLSDLNGNTSGCWALNSNFTTVLTAPSGGPQITQFIPPSGFTNVAENFKPQIQFDRPIQGTMLSGVTFVQTAGSVPVPMSAQLGGGGTLLTLVPNTILHPNTQYTVTVAGVVDAAGNSMAGSVTHSFTTGPSIDLNTPALVSMTPIYNSTVGTNPLLKMIFSKPINPISATNFAMYQYGIGRYLNGVSLTWSADLKSVTFNYPGPLDPNDRYQWYVNSFTDLAGNPGNTCCQYFYTSSSVDNTPLTVSSVTPPNGQTGVPVNPVISVRLNKPAAPTSVNNSSMTLSGVPGTTVSLSSDGLTLTLNRPAVLSANTTYTVTVPAGGFTDNNGNAVQTFSSSFTTSSSGLSDTSHGGVSLTVPSPGSTGVALNQMVTVTFSKPFNPNTILPDSFVVCYNNNCNNRIAGTVAIVDANHLSFTPAVAYPPNTTLGVFVYPFTAYMTDLAGNPFDSPYLYNATFTTASVVDNTPPSITNQTPAGGATNVGPYATVALTFNKSLNSSTVNTANFALYQGSANLGASVSISADRRTVYLSQTLPFGATITVSVNTNVQDYAGNNMAAPYTSTFTTEAQPLNFYPSVIQTRPGNGAPLNSKITIFTNSQMYLPAVQNGLFVAQNGALIAGTASLTADQHGIIWTPTANYLPNAYIEVFITSAITDTNNDPINATSFAFTTAAAACTTPSITAYNPGKYSGGNYLSNTVIEVQFCEPVNPATVTSSSFKVTTGSTPGSGTAITGAFSFLNNNTVVRFTPSSDLTAANYTAVQLTNAIQDMSANAFAGDGYYIYIQGTAVHNNSPLTVSTVTPVNGATGIGDNAPIRIVFSKIIDPLTITPTTVALSSGGAIPYSYTLSTLNGAGNQTVMLMTPLVPLPDSSTITVHVTTGLMDNAGLTCADSTTTFQTGAGADFSQPAVTQLSVDNHNNSGVPVNTTFTMVFSKPLDPSTVAGNPSGGNTCCFFYYDSSAPGGQSYPPSTVNQSPDLTTVTIIPTASMTPSISNMRYYWNGGADLNGNSIQTGSQFFTTAAGADSTPPTVVNTNPLNAATGAPTNTVIEIIFDKPVRGTSLGSIKLNGSPVTAVLNNSVYTNDTVVKLVPSTLLSPNTVYTVAVSGVQDVAGNTLTGTPTFSFTTGPNFNVNNPNFVSATVTTATPATVPLPQNTNVSNVLATNPTFTFAWDTAIDYASFLADATSCITLTDTSNNAINVPLTFVPSADQKTVTVQVNGSLTHNTQYRIWIHLQGYPVSISGVFDYNQRMFPFTTQP